MRLPLYRLYFDEEIGLETLKLSLVQDPAVESLFLKFKEDQAFQFSVVDEDQRIVFGVAMRADFPIYRNDNNLGEYFITFSKETIQKIQAEFLKTRRFNLNHETDTDAVEILESFLIDKEAGICPQAFSDMEDGSWLIKCKINSPELWKQIKDGVFKGFSIESFFEYDKVEFSKQINHKMTLKALKIKLAKLLLKLGTATAVKDEVEYTWEYDGPELNDVVEVFIEGEDGELVHPEDGEYVVGEDTWEVRDGIVRKVTKVEAPNGEEEVTLL